MFRDGIGNLDNDGFRIGVRQVLHQACAGHGLAYDTDGNSDEHGDDDPDGSDPAGHGQFILVFNGHKTEQDMRHAKITEAPGHGRNDGQQGVRRRAVGLHRIGFCKGEIPRQRFGIIQHCVYAAHH